MKTNIKNRYFLLVCFILIMQSGCAAFFVGAGTAAVVATDKRTAGDMIEDENIELKFINLLYPNKALSEHSHVNATSYNGWLLLTGEAKNPAVKQSIYNLAISIKNVSRVFNELTIATPSSMTTRASDTYITSKIKTRLLANEKTEGYHIKVVTEDGVVYLMGLISQQQSTEVIKVVKKVSGVQRIIKLFDYLYKE